MNSKTQTKKKRTIYRTGNVTNNRTSSKEGARKNTKPYASIKTHTHTHTKGKINTGTKTKNHKPQERESSDIHQGASEKVETSLR